MFYKGDVDEEKIFLIPYACACFVAVSCISADGAFENDSVLKAEHHAADSEQGKAAISVIDKPYDSAKVAVFDITLTKDGERCSRAARSGSPWRSRLRRTDTLPIT